MGVQEIDVKFISGMMLEQWRRNLNPGHITGILGAFSYHFAFDDDGHSLAIDRFCAVDVINGDVCIHDKVVSNCFFELLV